MNSELEARISGRWLGKAIRGTPGTPHEGKRGPLDNLIVGREAPSRQADLVLGVANFRTQQWLPWALSTRNL